VGVAKRRRRWFALDGWRSKRVTRGLVAGRSTRQRAAILRAFAASPDFVSAQSMHAQLVADGVQVGLTTVYRALRDLEISGHADVVRDDSGERLYRPRATVGHRHYLICRCCGRSQPVDSDVVEEWAARVTEDADYAEAEHTVELTGICARCRPLTDQGDPPCRSEPARPGECHNSCRY
jgi:Fur family transcriptional regulator, ferric uptake regulator